MCRVCSVLLLLVLVVGSARAQSSWDEDAIRAALEGNLQRVEELVRAERLGVTNVVNDLIKTGLDTADSSALDAAMLVAGLYSDLFGEEAHVRRVEFARALSPTQRRVKIQADSLYDEAFQRRTTPETREEARSLYLEALDLYESIGDLAGKSETRGQLGYVSWYLDRDAYLTYNEEALRLRRELGDLKLIGNSLNDIGVFHYAVSGNYERALDHFLESERIRWAIGDSTVLNRMLGLIADSYERLGQYDDARGYYVKAADLYLALGDTARYIRQRTNAAGLLTDYLELHTDALVEMLRLREDLRAINDARTEAFLMNSIGVVNRRLGDYEGAIQSYMEVIRLSEEHGFDDLLAGAYNNIGVVFIWTGRGDRSIPYFERSLEMSRALESDPGVLDATINLGSAHFETSQYERSIEYLNDALGLAGNLGDNVSMGTVYTGLGNALLKSAGPEQAEPQYHLALDIAETYELPDLLMGVQFGLGDAAEQREDPEEAFEWYSRAVATLESTRGMLRASEDKAGYLAQSRYLFEDVIDFTSRQAVLSDDDSWTAASFDFAERAKARAFVDQLAEALAGVQQGVDPELLSDQQILTDNLVYLRQELSLAEDSESRAALKGQIREQESEFNRVERELRERNPAYAQLRYPQTPDLASLQSSLKSDELVLAYSVGDSSSTLWSVTSTAAEMHLLPARPAIAAQVEVLRFALQDPTRTTAADYASIAGTLFETLAGPVREQISDFESVIVIPDDILNYVPFEALVLEAGEDFTQLDYLVRHASISYSQSAGVLLQMKNRPRSEPTMELLAVGNPEFGGTNQLSMLRSGALEALPYSGREVDTISSLFQPSRVDLFVGAEATESRIKTHLEGERYRFMHFATHGLINEERPDFSALALTRGDHPGEGLLQASEIFNLSISAELVVLSACETGLGQLIQGEGMVGLTRAFMYAGASSIVASLWSVADESTSLLMQEMYQGIISHRLAVPNALQTAKLTLIETPETAHPFYWAPFTVVGASQ